MTFDALVRHLLAWPGAARRITAIAGAPGSGKSTLAARLCQRINAARPAMCQVLAMDGYHFDDGILEARGERARKGAPFTFDVGGLLAMIARIRADDGTTIAIPVFDRDLEISRAAAALIAPEVRLVLVEGNYLLLDDPSWARLRPLFDLSVFLDVPRAELHRRLTARWQGFGLDAPAMRAKLDGNDMPNADLVIGNSVPADIVLRNDDNWAEAFPPSDSTRA